MSDPDAAISRAIVQRKINEALTDVRLLVQSAELAAYEAGKAEGAAEERQRIRRLATEVEADGESECYECGNSRLRHLVDLLDGDT